MDIFKEIFQYEIDEYYSNKTKPSSIFNFEISFIPKIFSDSIKKYGWLKFIRYKYFILENFLKCTYIVDKDQCKDQCKEDILTIFSRVQCKIMALYKLKNRIIFKKLTVLIWIKKHGI